MKRSNIYERLGCKRRRLIDLWLQEDESEDDIPQRIPVISSTSTQQVTSNSMNIQEIPCITETHSSSDYESTSDDSQSGVVNQHQGANVIWYKINGDLKQFKFNSPTGPTEVCFEKVKATKMQPLDFYLLFLDENILNGIVNETNVYASQKIRIHKANKTLTPHSRLNYWKDVSVDEIKQFLALILWMGLDKKPTINSYWSTNILYSNKISKTMSRNRFENILANIYFANKTTIQEDKLYKISSLVEQLNNTFREMYNPGESVCIEETTVPFRGSLFFPQYILREPYKYSIKIFKLCTKGGYTYCGKVFAEDKVRRSLANNVVLELMGSLLNSCRTLYTDEFYTSVELANSLLAKKTHLVGTLRTNRKYNPIAVTKKMLKRGEMHAVQSNTAVIVGKWKDKRDVLFLTTKHIPEMIKLNNKEKPNVIVDYNKTKSFISDQLSSYATTIRKGIKWYRKLAIEFLTNTTVINSYHLYYSITGKTMSITQFREELVLALINTPKDDLANIQPDIQEQHKLEDTLQRGRCISCYTTLSKECGRQHAAKHAKQLKQKCSVCPDRFMCNDCFFSKHLIRVKKSV